jgi:hypothetical protein
MNWEAIGAIGETVGALAVILTLIYLAFQIRYSKNATLDQKLQSIAPGAAFQKVQLRSNCNGQTAMVHVERVLTRR